MGAIHPSRYDVRTDEFMRMTSSQQKSSTTTRSNQTPSQNGMAWLNRIRLRVIVFVIGIPLAAVGAISLSPAWLTLPLVGMAFAAVTMSVSKLTSRIAQDTCLTCGGNLVGQPQSENGVICPHCGALNLHLAHDDDDESDSDESSTQSA